MKCEACGDHPASFRLTEAGEEIGALRICEICAEKTGWKKMVKLPPSHLNHQQVNQAARAIRRMLGEDTTK